MTEDQGAMEKKTGQQKVPSCQGKVSGTLDDVKKIQPRPYKKKDYGTGRRYDSQDVVRQPKNESQFQSRNYKRDTYNKRNSERIAEGIQTNDHPKTLNQRKQELDDGYGDFSLNTIGPNKAKSYYLNFKHASLNRQAFFGDGARRHRKISGSKSPSYNKEAFLQANCQFIVKSEGDYSLHTVDPNLLVDWHLIEQVCLLSHEVPSCPICLYPPTVAKITRCGHVYCWPCILHYLHLGEKSWRRCPICYEAIHAADLKSVMAISNHKFKAGEKITMQLMKRGKGSIMSMPVSAWEDREGKPKEWEGGERCNISKLCITSPRTVLEGIVNIEKLALEQQLKEARSEQSGEECFIESAIVKLQEKEKDLIEKINEQSPKIEQVKPKVKNPLVHVTNICEIESKVIDDNYEVAFSEDEDDEKIQKIKEKKNTNNASGDSIATSPLPKSLDKIEAKRSMSSSSSGSSEPDIETRREQVKSKQHTDFYYFYQVEDGQNIFINPINVRCLVEEYGSLQDCPEKVTAQIIEMETYTMNQDLRKRFRYLSHLPDCCEFAICEMMLKPPIVSKEILVSFTEEFRKRKLQRQKKKREQRKFERKVEERVKLDSFGRVIIRPLPEVLLNLDSLEEFPMQNPQKTLYEDAMDESSSREMTSPTVPPVTPNSIPSIWGSSSFAQALQTNKKPAVKQEALRSRTISETSSKDFDKCLENEFSENEDTNFAAAPSFSDAFSEAFALSFTHLDHKNGGGAAAAATGSSNKKGGKKKKKEKKLLFSTGIVRKYQ